jgi:hypothetical protein
MIVSQEFDMSPPTYAMSAIVSFIFWVIGFHYEGKIVTIDQLDYYTTEPQATHGQNILFLVILIQHKLAFGLECLGIHPS